MDFKFSIIETITNDFSKDQKVGTGGYGDVYKAVYKGEEIAVKKLHPLKDLDDKQFHSEFLNLTNISHKNIVRLIGYCYESRKKFMDHNGKKIWADSMERVLCFEYMQGGSLDKHISDESCGLDWPTCYDIIRGTCEGLNHLHSAPGNPIFHLDLKPANILLDKIMTPKIADLGLSRVFDSSATHETQIVQGSHGYMPPEYLKRRLISKKFDVFSLGVIIIKIVAGNNGHFGIDEMSHEDFIKIVTENWTKQLQAMPGLYSSYEIDILRVNTCAQIALRCVDKEREKRPCIQEIVDELEKLEADIKKMSLSSDLSKDLTVQISCDSNFVSLDPTLQLCFLFKPRKEASCCLLIINKTDSFIAFDVKINRIKYRVQPSRGTMEPCSKRYIVVTMEAQQKAPPNMQCNDVILVQSTSVSQDMASEEDEIDYQELFETAMAERVVDVVKLPIMYVALEQ